jgi:hypothetical protein
VAVKAIRQAAGIASEAERLRMAALKLLKCKEKLEIQTAKQHVAWRQAVSPRP